MNYTYKEKGSEGWSVPLWPLQQEPPYPLPDEIATPSDVTEYSTHYVYEIEMPGLKARDINVQVVQDKVLLVNGERKMDEEKEKVAVNFISTERRLGKFTRSFVLPQNADVNTVSALCKDGVLSVTVRKLPPPPPTLTRIIKVMAA